MSDRRRPQLELALRHLHDIREPSPKAPSMRAEAGFAPAHRIPCPDCGHSDDPGWHVDGFKRRTPCATCGGQPADQGRRAKGGKGAVMVDPMDADRKAIGSTDTHATARPVRMVLCDGCGGDGSRFGSQCGYCGGVGRRPLHAFNLAIDTREQDAILDHVQRQVDQRAKDLRWVELETAMARLKREKWNSWRLVHRVYVIRVLRVEDVYGRTGAGLSYETLENGMAYLLWRLPEDWTAPAGLRANEREHRTHLQRVKGRGSDARSQTERDKLIRQWESEGKPRTWIQWQTGLSERQLRKIVNGRTEAA